MSTTPTPTPRPADEAVKAFREYLAVHPEACAGMGGHAMDDMALDLARIAPNFQAPALELEPGYSTVRPPSDEEFAQQDALALLAPHAQDLHALSQVAKQVLAMVGAPAPAPSDAQLLALNEGERFFSESPSKYPEAGHGTQYHAGAPGVLAFARAVLALGGAPRRAGAQDAVLQAIRDYHFALDNRQHGGVAADTALKAIEAALGTQWVQGQELAARAAPGATT